MERKDLLAMGYIAKADVPKMFQNNKIFGTKTTPWTGLRILTINPRLLRGDIR